MARYALGTVPIMNFSAAVLTLGLLATVATVVVLRRAVIERQSNPADGRQQISLWVLIPAGLAMALVVVAANELIGPLAGQLAVKAAALASALLLLVLVRSRRP